MMDASESVSPPVAKSINEICDHFELAWKGGQKPRIEDFLGSAVGLQRSALLRGLLQRELELVGRDGGELLASSYQQRFTDDAELVASVLKGTTSCGLGPDAGLTGTVSLRQSPVETSHSQAPSSSWPVPAPADTNPTRRRGSPEPPEKLGRFEILRMLGQGAFGTVYHARDPQLGREVAIKLPRVETVGDHERAERFLREARAAASLRHPNICPVYEIVEADGRHLVVMAFIAGQPLSAFTKGDEQMAPRQAALLIRKLAVALRAAHQQGIVHRDLKPDNIMIDSEQHEPVIMDFGLARVTTADDVHLTVSGQIMGTPAYMPPEQARGEIDRICPASDVYSLGVILYELLCGQRPFRGSSIADVLSHILLSEPPPPRAHRPSVDPCLEAICLKAISKKIEDRYASMADLAADLDEYLARGAGQPRTAAVIASPETRSVSPQATAEPEVEAMPLLPVPGATTPDGKSSASEPVIHEPADRARPRQRANGWWSRIPPVRRWMVIGGGAAGAAVIVLLGIILLIPTAKGTVKIELSDPQAEVAVQLDGDTIDITGLKDPLRLKVGEHHLQVSGENFETVGQSFTVHRNTRPVLTIQLIPKTAASSKPRPDVASPVVTTPEGSDSNIPDVLSQPADYALRFDDRGERLEIPSLIIPARGWWTIEGWVTPRAPLPKNSGEASLVFLIPSKLPAWLAVRHQGAEGIKWSAGGPVTTPPPHVYSRDAVVLNERTHVALTHDPEGVSLYVNGVLQGQPLPIVFFGDAPVRICQEPNLSRRDVAFHGDIDEIRISSIARYTGNFTPQPRFEPDDETLALYHFDEGQGEVLNDSSHHALHGKIFNATWVRRN